MVERDGKREFLRGMKRGENEDGKDGVDKEEKERGGGQRKRVGRA